MLGNYVRECHQHDSCSMRQDLPVELAQVCMLVLMKHALHMHTMCLDSMLRASWCVDAQPNVLHALLIMQVLYDTSDIGRGY